MSRRTFERLRAVGIALLIAALAFVTWAAREWEHDCIADRVAEKLREGR